MKNQDRTAYPTYLDGEDNVSPGLTKLEVVALAVLPKYIATGRTIPAMINEAFEVAEQFCAEAEKRQQ
jgi:hypothetical protein